MSKASRSSSFRRRHTSSRSPGSTTTKGSMAWAVGLTRSPKRAWRAATISAKVIVASLGPRRPPPLPVLQLFLVMRPAAGGAGPPGAPDLGVGHGVDEPPHPRRPLEVRRPRHDHQVRLARGRPEGAGAEAVDVEARG